MEIHAVALPSRSDMCTLPQLSRLNDGLVGSTLPFWEKDTDVRHPDRATPQSQHTHATTGTHSSCHHLRAWRLACTCVPSVIGACVAASKAVAAASVLQEDFSPCVPVWMPWSVLLYERKAFPPASFFGATSSFSTSVPFSVAFFSLAHCVTECVLQFFMDQVVLSQALFSSWRSRRSTTARKRVRIVISLPVK